jgi:hypothetical protein
VRLLVVSFVTVCSIATGCGADSKEGGTEEPTATAPAAIACDPVPRQLVGTYMTVLREQDLTPEVFDIRLGKKHLSLGPGHQGFRYDAGDFEGRAKERADFGGRVCVSGDLISFPDEPPGGACAGLGRSVFRWRLEEDKLHLSVVRDRCVYSAFHHSVHPWTRVSSRPGFDEP